jgi:hypothetical protein
MAFITVGSVLKFRADTAYASALVLSLIEAAFPQIFSNISTCQAEEADIEEFKTKSMQLIDLEDADFSRVENSSAIVASILLSTLIFAIGKAPNDMNITADKSGLIISDVPI